ncbi:uncharacterized protein LOC133829149 [Humulus lupulus]|uniref:uncharacterized protein LOC133829149 n=1 Tax=Humulus lupulus TaxID=3486 RepID=UPI002B413821|nr:uncharacterized protein LOC133829149 [Humulus lupulus]
MIVMGLDLHSLVILFIYFSFHLADVPKLCLNLHFVFYYAYLYFDISLLVDFLAFQELVTAWVVILACLVHGFVTVLVASEAHAITLAVEGLLGVVFTVAALTDEAMNVGEVQITSRTCQPDPKGYHRM